MRAAQAVAGLAVVGLTAIGQVGVSTGAAAAPHAHQKATYAKTPTIKVTVTNTGTDKDPTFKTSINRKSLTSGLVKVSVHGVKTGAEISLLSFKKGYSYNKYIKDFTTFETSQDSSTGQYSKAGIKALNHAVHHTHWYGGPTAESPGDTQTDVLDIAAPAKVYVLNDSNENGPPSVIGTVKVTGKAAHRKAVKIGGTIVAKTNSKDRSRFSGDKKLSHKGYIKFAVAKSSTTPHFLDFSHVKEGTTKKQVMDYLNSSAAQNGQPPSFALKGEVDTDTVSPGHAQDVHVDLPKGEYVSLCFFPDLKDGTPHAFMGMIGIYHLV